MDLEISFVPSKEKYASAFLSTEGKLLRSFAGRIFLGFPCGKVGLGLTQKEQIAINDAAKTSHMRKCFRIESTVNEVSSFVLASSRVSKT